MKDQDTYLRKLNVAAVCAHVAVLILEVVILATLYTPKNGFDTTSYVTTYGSNSLAAKGMTDSRRTAVDGHVMIMPILLVCFTLTTIAAHASYATWLRKKYNEQVIVKRHNWFRWVEYAISASIMLVIVAIASGVADANALFVIPVISVCVMLLGFVIEKNLISDIRSSCLVTGISWLLYMAAWSFIFVQYREVKRKADIYNSEVPGREEFPDYVSVLVAVMFVMYTSFGGVQLAQLAMTLRRKQTDPIKIETSYIVLSFVAKALLPIIYAYALTQRSKYTSKE